MEKMTDTERRQIEALLGKIYDLDEADTEFLLKKAETIAEYKRMREELKEKKPVA